MSAHPTRLVLAALCTLLPALCPAYSDPAPVALPIVPRLYSTFLPKDPPPAQHLYVADIEQTPLDQKLLLVSLQGIVNRRRPRIYLISKPQDRFWLQQMQAQGQTSTEISVADPLTLVKTFRAEIQGAVIPDPNVYVTPQVAVDIAGQRDLLIATPALAQTLNLPIKADLRGRFKDDADALHYARTVLLPRSNRYVSICLNSPLDTGATDQVIAAKGTAFWVTGPNAQSEPGANQAGELREVTAMLAEMPLNAVVFGYWYSGSGGMGLDEGPGVQLASQYGKVTVVSDYLTNMSVLSGVQIPQLHQKPPQPAPALDRSKVYVAIAVSDGDNLCTWQNNFRDLFDDPLHGAFPIAWGMGPSLRDAMPTLAAWYYTHAAPDDEFLCDVSGVGYMYPSHWAESLRNRDAAFASFYRWTQSYMDKMDMRSLRLMNVQPDDITRVGALLPISDFLMPDYGYSGETSYSAITYTLPTGQPVFRAVTGGNPNNMAGEIRTRIGPTRPAFVNAFIVNWGLHLSTLKAMLADLGPDYVAVTPSQLNTLYRQSQAK